jgi:wyosine [tRNA(Phe)-imidazoG37] synthetase (radical SAM superfamily)
MPGQSGEKLKRAAELLTEIEQGFAEHAKLGTPVDCITLAGNGEPTLHPDLDELVSGILALRDTHFPGAKVGILTDATQVMRPKVRHALERLDARYMKFDAADDATWKRINKPFGGVSFAEIMAGLKTLPDIILQSMFIQGSFDNTDETHITAWVKAVGEIKPSLVQVYTIDRGTAAPGITEVPRAALEAIATRLTQVTGIPTEVFD